MNRYVLKKDLPGAKAGTRSEYKNGTYSFSDNNTLPPYIIDERQIDLFPDWFEKERWKPSNGKLYDYVEINSSGVVLHREAWHDDKWDNKRFDSFNCFDPDSKDNRAGNVAAKIEKVLRGEI
jgi:hypothetical protein